MIDFQSVSAVSGLIGSIYDCAIDPTRWQGTLTELREYLGFHNANLSLQSLPSGELLLNIASGIEDRWFEAMHGYGEDVVRQWGGLEKIQSYPLDVPQVLSWVDEKSEWRGNRYYMEWAEPQGLIDVMAIGIARDQRSVGTIGLGRHRDDGPITRDVARAAALFIPHLQRAVAISRLIEIKSIAVANFETVLDTLSAAVTVVDDELRIVHHNRAAAAVFTSGQAVSNSGGRLRAASPEVSAAILAAVARAASNEAELCGRSFGVPIRSGGSERYIVNVLPLRSGRLRGQIWPAAAAAIFLAPASDQSREVPLGLAALFGLTPAEVAVYNHVFRGASNAQISAELGISISTVKTHLQHVFDKTGARRQSQLVALAASFVLPLRQ